MERFAFKPDFRNGKRPARPIVPDITAGQAAFARSALDHSCQIILKFRVLRGRLHVPVGDDVECFQIIVDRIFQPPFIPDDPQVQRTVLRIVKFLSDFENVPDGITCPVFLRLEKVPEEIIEDRAFHIRKEFCLAENFLQIGFLVVSGGAGVSDCRPDHLVHGGELSAFVIERRLRTAAHHDPADIRDSEIFRSCRRIKLIAVRQFPFCISQCPLMRHGVLAPEPETFFQFHFSSPAFMRKVYRSDLLLLYAEL